MLSLSGDALQILLKLTLIHSKKSPKMLEFVAIFGDFNLKSAFT